MSNPHTHTHIYLQFNAIFKRTAAGKTGGGEEAGALWVQVAWSGVAVTCCNDAHWFKDDG